MKKLGLIAGKGIYPQMVIEGARKAGVERIVMTAFEGETFPETAALAQEVEWLKVGQLGKMISFFKKNDVTEAMMAGQITPKRLFDLRPDLKAILILARLRKRNAETLFGAIAEEMEKSGVSLLPATTYMDEHLAPSGLIAGPKVKRGILRDIEFGWSIAKEVARLDIGQTIVVRNGTVLAVEGFDGTDATIRRGGDLGHGGAVVIKVSKPKQDFRFDVPVVGPQTLKVAGESSVAAIVCESGKTLLLARDEINDLARQYGVSLFAKENNYE